MTESYRPRLHLVPAAFMNAEKIQPTTASGCLRSAVDFACLYLIVLVSIGVVVGVGVDSVPYRL
jgi:hypothetical protein